MVFLQSKDDYSKYARFDMPSGEIDILHKNNLMDSKSIAFCGTFSRLDSMLILFFRYNGQLILKIDDKIWNINGKILSKWEVSKKTNTIAAAFSVIEDGNVVYRKEYIPFGSREIVKSDFTAFVDEEDYDYLLFISNVINSPERRADIYKDVFVL